MTLFGSILLGCQSQFPLTRGIGVYPGDPAQDFSPVQQVDRAYRNIALNKAAMHSSSFDYNLTAQLVTDGIACENWPATICVSNQDGPLPKREREWFFDGKPDSKYRTKGTDIMLQLDVRHASLSADRMELKGGVTFNKDASKGYSIEILGSTDGTSWQRIDFKKGSDLIGQEKPNPYLKWVNRPAPPKPTGPQPSFSFQFSMPKPERQLIISTPLDKAAGYTSYRIALHFPAALEWSFSDWNFFDQEKPLSMLASQYFNSAWMSAGTQAEWVSVDFGHKATFDKVILHWVNKASKGQVEVSDDAQQWTAVADLPGGDALTDAISIKNSPKGRYVRIRMDESSNGQPYVLGEVEVLGKEALAATPKPACQPEGNRLLLNGGDWRIQRASEVADKGEDIASASYTAAQSWLPATVPATVLSSYRNAGALPDPNYGANQLYISESFFYSDFWYRHTFSLPADFPQEEVFLHFDGINWKAEIYLNGLSLGRIDGAFIRGQFNITSYLNKDDVNVLAVKIIKNDNPGAVKEQNKFSPDQNGGVLGLDNPTFHASVGWDWIPTIRGRNIGIWDNVYVSTAGLITLADPFVQTELALPDTTQATVTIQATLTNHGTESATGVLSGTFGEMPFSESAVIAPKTSQTVTATLTLPNPNLWWPNGYGPQPLYDVTLKALCNDVVSDQTQFKAGVRQMSFNEDNGILSLFVNGRRFIGRGGNWGFSESNLNYRAREYDAAVAYHADMNFTMIRNWVGQIGEDAFYDACDRYGIMVWQDFWLANPADGPNPHDEAMFMANAADKVKRIRNHPSIAIYVGRNEGNPPQSLDDALRALVPQLHPGMHYISHSAAGVVSGGGPYRALPARDYFLLYGKDRFHSERGMPNVMTYESLAQTIPQEYLWPQNDVWGIHDYTLNGAQGAESFNQIIEKAFGPSQDARQFTERAQWINYEGYRAIFEGRSEFRRGMLLWMSHPAWPSMVWQTYDYYLEPTAAYFGCKKANEPIHIQWNPVYNNIEVVNQNAHDQKDLTARAQWYNSDGSLQWEKSITLDCQEDSTALCFPLEFPESLSDVHFLRLNLYAGGHELSNNFYWRSKDEGNYKALAKLPRPKILHDIMLEKKGDIWHITSIVRNDSQTPALMIRLQAIGQKSQERILPAFYSDNYISLMPHEERVIITSVKVADCRGERPTLTATPATL